MRSRQSAVTNPAFLTERGVSAFRADVEARGARLRVAGTGYIEVDYPAEYEQIINAIIDIYEKGIPR